LKQGPGLSQSRLIDWPSLMALGLGRLGLAPAHFWALTPRELERALAGAAGHVAFQTPLDRTALEELMRRYPDRNTQGR